MIRCHGSTGACRRHFAAARSFAAVGMGLLILGLLFSPGCATARRPPPAATVVAAPAMGPAPAPVPKTQPIASVVATPPAATPQVPPPTVPAETSAPTDELTIVVESTPAGATIVMDGRPIGKAPLHLSIPATPLGFFRDYVEIRARFIATDETEISRTATQEFTPREKVPAVLQFTPDGSQRTVR